MALEPAGRDIYDRLKAIETVSSATGENIPPLSGKFKDLQDAMAPRAIELYGDALNALSGGNMGSLSKAITGVVDLLDKWGAEIDIWMGKSDGMSNAIQKGTGYLSQLGQFIANIVVAIQNLMKAEPGVAHFVLDFVDGFTKAFAILTGISPLLDKVALALHGVMLWGGLLASIFVNMAVGILKPISALGNLVTGTKAAQTAMGQLADDATPVQKLQAIAEDIGSSFLAMGGNIKTWAVGIGADMAEAEGAVATGAAGIKGIWEGLIGVLDIVPPVAWIAAIAAGVGYLAYQTTQASGSVKTFISQLQGSVGQMQASQAATSGITDAVGQLNAKIASTNVSSELQNWGGSWQHLGDDARGVLTDMAQGIGDISSGSVLGGLQKVGDAIKGIFIPGAGAAQQATNDINAYKQAISGLTSSQKTMFQVAGTTMKDNQVTFTQSLGLMDLAGVKTSDSFQVALAKVNGLITGYKNLGIQGGYLGSSINAVTLQTEQQQSQVQQLAQAWTNFINLVTGGESSFVTVAQQVQGTLSAAGGAADQLSISNGKVTSTIKDASGAAGGAKVNIDSLSSSGLALKSSFIQTEQSMSANLNSLQQLSAAGGQGKQGLNEVNQAGKDYVASLLPMASKSQDATAMLYALAQQAGYTGADSFKSLAQWVGNVQNPMQQAEDITNKLTIAAGNLAKDVQNLASAINTDLNQAMAEAVLNANGTQKAFNAVATAIKTSHGNISDIIPSVKTLGQDIYQDLGGNISETNNELTTFMTAMGLSPAKIKAILAQVDASFAQSATNIEQSLSTIQGRIDALHGKNVTITESVEQTISQAGAIPIGVAKAAGGLIGGTGNSDSVPAMLTPGEAVVPKHLVSAIAPFMAANGVPGFASGGMVAPMLPPAPDLTGLAQLLAQLSADTSWADWNAAQPAGKITGPQTAGQNAAEGFQMAAWAQQAALGVAGHAGRGEHRRPGEPAPAGDAAVDAGCGDTGDRDRGRGAHVQQRQRLHGG